MLLANNIRQAKSQVLDLNSGRDGQAHEKDTTRGYHHGPALLRNASVWGAFDRGPNEN